MTAITRSTDEQRLAATYDELAPAILRYFLRRADSAEDAADLVAETFLVAWRRIGDLPPGDDARPWLFGVAHNLLLNHRRGRRRQSTLARRLADELDQLPPVAAPDDPRAAALASAIQRLHADDRDLLLLTAWDGLTTEEAAQVLGILATTARSRLSRARQRLRDEISQTLALD